MAQPDPVPLFPPATADASASSAPAPAPRVGGAPFLAAAPIPVARADQPASAYAPPAKFIVVTCRPLTSAEQLVFANNFKQILTYNASLSSSFDLTKMAFDLMIIDASDDASHLFLEIVSPSCKQLNIPIIVLKLRFSNYKALANALEASVVTEIKDLGGASLLSYLTKTKLPRLENRLITWGKKAFRSLFG